MEWELQTQLPLTSHPKHTRNHVFAKVVGTYLCKHVHHDGNPKAQH